MKALVSIQFALELDDEDQLTQLAQTLDESLFESIKDHLARGTLDQGAVELLELGGLIDWYGASVAIKRPVFETAIGGD